MVIGCMRLTDVGVIDTIRSYENRKKVWGCSSYTERTAQGKDFELILTAKIETIQARHPVEGQFGRKFPAICNHCRVMTA